MTDIPGICVLHEEHDIRVVELSRQYIGLLLPFNRRRRRLMLLGIVRTRSFWSVLRMVSRYVPSV
jgi:hypothetical protein